MLLVYSIVDEQSFEEMGQWLQEMKANLGEDIIIHVVGTKCDVVAQDPGKRMVSFERCIAFVTENLFPDKLVEPIIGSGSDSGFKSLDGTSKRSSGFWGQEIGYDTCHEISSSSGEGIEEVFRVITRKLVEQKQRKAEAELAAQAHINATARKPRTQSDGQNIDGNASFRVGYGDKRRSWLGLPTSNIGIGESTDGQGHDTKPRRRGCC